MRLRSLTVERLPGIRPGFELHDVAPGVNVVVGPNASGKSSVLRAVQALLYPEEHHGAGVVLEGVFDEGDGELRVSRVGDTVSWTRDGSPVSPPTLPEHHLLGCYTLRVEDLTAAGATDEAIAARLGLELSGGYDLGAVRRSVFRPRGTGQSEARRLRETDEALHRVLREREALVQQQAQIARWTRMEREAEEARRDADDHRKALDLIAARREAQRAQAELERFPEGMEHLVGDEGRRLAALHADIEQRTRELADAQHDEQAARRTLDASGLASSALSAADLEERTRVLQELYRWESEGASAEDRRRRVRAELERASGALGSTGPEGARPHLDPATLSEVDEALEAKRRSDAELHEMELELERLPREDERGDVPEQLREARGAVLSWLAAARRPRWTAGRWLGLVLAIGAGGGLLTLALLAGAGPLLPAALMLLLLAGLPLMSRDASAARQREAARERYQRTDLPAQDRWDERALTLRLQDLDERIASAEVLRQRLERRAETERRRASAQSRRAEVDASIAALAGRVGFDPAELDAGLQRWLRLVEAIDRAGTELRDVEAELRAKLARIDAAREGLVRFLREHDEAVDSPSPSASVLEARLDTLARRLKSRDDARAARERALDAIVRAARELKRLHEAVRALLAGAALDPGDTPSAATDSATDAVTHAERELRARLERLPDYRQCHEAARAAQLRHADRREALAHRDDLLAAADAEDEQRLRDRLAELEAAAERGRQVSNDIAVTRDRIRQAEHDRALERARADRQAAAEALDDRLQEALAAEAGAFLLDAVASEHEQTSQPAALRQAGAWFRRFTRGQYELLFDGSDSAPFTARETASGERRTPAELSTGTRAQLLLAVRVAFATLAEQGRASLPLFLDEALTTADVERFRAVGEGLSLLAHEGGRQLFYLTARPEDAQFWAGAADGRPHLIDIARVRRLGRAAAEPEAFALPPQDELPSPAGRSPEAYARDLGVPPIDPWQPVDACHLFHLLRDDLP
ncbi:MAG: AAA family ATPase, partial [Deinococcales bacterium]